MKKTKSTAVAMLFITLTCKVLAADITITGPTSAYAANIYTYYATPTYPIPPSGYSFTWSTPDATVIMQNGNPYAGQLYCQVLFDTVTGQTSISIADNHGNSGYLSVNLTMFAFNSPSSLLPPLQKSFFVEDADVPQSSQITGEPLYHHTTALYGPALRWCHFRSRANGQKHDRSPSIADPLV